MADFGLLPEGFVPATTAEVRDELEEGVRDSFGRSLPLGDKTLFGHFIGINSERLGALWEVGESSFSSLDTDKATGDALRARCSLTGTFEKPASSSTVTVVNCGDDGTILAQGQILATASTEKKFLSSDDVTLLQLDDWAITTGYEVGDRVTNSERCYECVTAGISAGAGGPTTAPAVDAVEVDGTVEWRYLGEGEAAGDVIYASEDLGEIVAVAGDLTDIQTPVAGWNTALNLEDAELGRNAMSDEELRLTRDAELANPGTGTPDALRAALLDLDDVTSVTVFENRTDLTVDGLPPHSFECMVQGGTDQDILQCIWDNHPNGIASYGSETGAVVDSEGFTQEVKFSRPDEIPIYVVVALTKDPKKYSGDATVKAAIAGWDDDKLTGKDAVASAISAQCFRVGGVIDVTTLNIGIAPAPVTAVTVPITRRQLATYDVSRITLVSTDGEP